MKIFDESCFKLVGSGEAGRSVMRTLLARPDLGYKTVGYVDDATGENNIGLGRIPHLGTMHELDRILGELVRRVPENTGLKIGPATEGIDHVIREGIVPDGVDREVPPRRGLAKGEAGIRVDLKPPVAEPPLAEPPQKVEPPPGGIQKPAG